MGYTSPAFMVAHPLSTLPLSAITELGISAMTDDSKRAITDHRQGELGSWTASGAAAGVWYSFDGFTLPRVDRCIVPAGHTFNGFRLELLSDDDVGFGSSANQFSEVISGSAVIDMVFSLLTDHVEWLLRVNDSVNNDVFTLGEFWIGERVPIATADVQPFFDREWIHRVAKRVIGGRDLSLELTPPRRRFGLSLRYVDPGSADFTILEEVMRLGVSKPFWYWPPDSTDPGPYLVKLERSATRRQERVAPQVTISYSIDLVMIEQTT